MGWEMSASCCQHQGLLLSVAWQEGYCSDGFQVEKLSLLCSNPRYVAFSYSDCVFGHTTCFVPQDSGEQNTAEARKVFLPQRLVLSC